MQTSRYDVIVVGGGAAGLSAALVLSRARRRVLVLDSAAPRNAPATAMHGFLSRDGMPPGDLLAAGREEVEAYGGEIVTATVGEVERDGGAGFRAVVSDGRVLHGRRLLVATGLRDEIPDIPGLRERWARDVLHCPYCHGFEVRDRKLAVLGSSAQAVGYAQIVRQWSADLTYVSHDAPVSDADRRQLEARGIAVVEGTVARALVLDDRLRGVELDDGTTVPCEALFVPPRFVPNSQVSAGLGCELDDDGFPVTDATGRTSVAGVWVAGNVANARAQVITAAGEGSAAAIALNADLVAEDVRDALATTTHEELEEAR